MTNAFVVLLLVFGLAVAFRGAKLLWRLRVDPPGRYTASVTLIGALNVLIGISAVAAAALRSGPAFGVLVVLMVALPVSRTVARRRHGL